MNSIAFNLAASVTAVLNGMMSSPYQARHVISPEWDAAASAEPSIEVWANGSSAELITRGAVKRTVEIGIAVRQRLTETSLETVDQLIQLCEQIVQMMITLRIDNARAVSVSIEPFLDGVSLRNLRAFESVITVDFELIG